MSTTDLSHTSEDAPHGPPQRRRARQWAREHSELGVSLLLGALGVAVLLDTLAMDGGFVQRGPVGPMTMPVTVGVALLVVAVLLARDVLRGGRGQSEGGEDVDLTASSDWRTVLLLTAAFLANAVLITVIGFPLSGMILFWGCAYALGSRGMVRDPLIAAVVSLVTFLAFNNLLGVPLPAGPLMGVL